MDGDHDGANGRGASDRSAEPTTPIEDGANGTVVPDAFDVLADETRWAIVRELATYRRTNWQLGGLEFAELRRAVGVPDAGRFNYHLNRLRDRFVLQMDGRYVLSNEGLELVGAVLAGAYDTAPISRRGQVAHVCPRCDERLAAVYEFGYLRLECPTHETIFGTVVPKRPAADRSIDDLVAVAGRAARNDIASAAAGVCPHCWGVVETTVADGPPTYPGTELDDRAAALAYVTVDCRDCGFRYGLPAAVFLVTHPAVVSYRHDHGDDSSGVPLLGTALTSALSTRLDRATPTETQDFPQLPDATEAPEPAVAVVAYVADSDRLVVWLDEQASVVATERQYEYES